MSIPREEWWTDHTNLAALLRWLVDHDEIGTSVDAIARYLAEPWDYSPEYRQMVGATQLQRAPKALVERWAREMVVNDTGAK